jgi:Undecaprenyl-phosphate galactose phosphotransferase WbaP
MAVDAAAVLAAGVGAWALWAAPVQGQPLRTYAPALPVIVLVVVAYAQAGLHPGFGLGPVETLRRYSLVTIGAYVALAALTFALKSPDIYSRATLTLAALLTLVLVPVGHWVLQRAARRWPWWREPVVLVGSGARTRRAAALLEEQPRPEYRPVGVLLDTADEGRGARRDAADRHLAELPVLGTLGDARAVARAGVQMVFADLSGPEAEGALDHLRLVFPRVVILRRFEELPVEGVQVRNLGGVLGLEYGSNLLRREARWLKRAIDLVVGTGALLVSLPLILTAMAAVKVLSPGPALYRQRREGLKGRTFQVPKVRTMVPDAERRLEEILARDAKLRAEWEAGFKLQRDPRLVPGVGRVLRRFSIDELPQLWCVVTGDMSLVGPRPFPAYHLEALDARTRRLRNQVRPGLTGLWQVTARGEAGVEAQQVYDIYYIRNWSVWLDLHILARTVAVVLTGRGAY